MAADGSTTASAGKVPLEVVDFQGGEYSASYKVGNVLSKQAKAWVRGVLFGGAQAAHRAPDFTSRPSRFHRAQRMAAQAT